MKVLIFLALLLAYLGFLGARPLGIPDEARYAEIPREILVSGNWNLPTLNGLRYFEKPTLGYWLISGSFALFGENAFALRLPSSLAALGTALLLFVILRQAKIDRQKIWLGPVILLSSILFFAVGTLATLDSMFGFFVSLSLTAFWLATESSATLKRNLFLGLCGLGCALAFLTKGFLAFVLPVFVFLPYMIWQKRFFDLFKFCWIPLAVVLIICLPWGFQIHAAAPDFWNFFFWNEHVRRFSSAKAQHAEALWFYLPVLLWGLLPWSFFLPSVIASRRELIKNSVGKLGVCWALGTLFFFSISSGKLITYLMPCIPGIVLLFALSIQQRLEGIADPRWQRLLGFLALLMSVTLLALVANEAFYLFSRQIFQLPTEAWKLSLLVCGLMAWILAWWHSSQSKNNNDALPFFAIGPVCLFLVIPWVLPQQTLLRKFPQKFIEQALPDVYKQTILVADQRLAGLACWLFKRNDLYLISDPGEMEYGLKYPDAQRRHLRDAQQFSELLNSIEVSPGAARLLIIGDRLKIKEFLSIVVEKPIKLKEDSRHMMAWF